MLVNIDCELANGELENHRTGELVIVTIHDLQYNIHMSAMEGKRIETYKDRSQGLPKGHRWARVRPVPGQLPKRLQDFLYGGQPGLREEVGNRINERGSS